LKKPRRKIWAGHVELMGELGVAYKVLVGRPNGKRPLGIPRYRGKFNMKVDLQELEWEGINRITQVKDRWRALVNAVMSLRFHKMWGIS
jgi:hypothetical protein